jgi:hypothetical protein
MPIAEFLWVMEMFASGLISAGGFYILITRFLKKRLSASSKKTLIATAQLLLLAGGFGLWSIGTIPEAHRSSSFGETIFAAFLFVWGIAGVVAALSLVKKCTTQQSPSA